MAHTVLATIARRLQREGRFVGTLPEAPPERPPLAELGAKR
jgi:hypothetical protein